MEDISEDPYDTFKEIRRTIRRYSSRSIIGALISKLNEELDDANAGHYPPFALLIILKWTIQWGNELNIKKNHIQTTEFINLVNLWHRMHSNMRMPSDFPHVSAFLRLLAYQQFWLQRRATSTSIARQFILFRRSEPTHLFNESFRSAYGIELNEFLDLTLALAGFLSEPPGTGLTKSWFSSLNAHYPESSITRYLDLITSDFNETRFALQNSKRVHILDEFYERSEFRLKPFLHDSNNDRYVLISRCLLDYFLVYGTYELLRSLDPERFMTKFGPIFERHVFQCLNSTNVSFDCSEQIAKVTQNNQNVDFVVSSSKALIFIDAKGVEMRFKGHVSVELKTISENLKNSVNKGIRQGYSTNHYYKLHSKSNLKKESFIIVVTYKELFLGDGNTFSESVGTNLLNDLDIHYPAWAKIPAENMFFIDIHEFERLAEIVRSTNMPFEQILIKARQESKDSHQKKFQFSQYLDGIKQGTAGPDFMREALEKEFSKLLKILKPGT